MSSLLSPTKRQRKPQGEKRNGFIWSNRNYRMESMCFLLSQKQSILKQAGYLLLYLPLEYLRCSGTPLTDCINIRQIYDKHRSTLKETTCATSQTPLVHPWHTKLHPFRLNKKPYKKNYIMIVVDTRYAQYTEPPTGVAWSTHDIVHVCFWLQRNATGNLCSTVLEQICTKQFD